MMFEEMFSLEHSIVGREIGQGKYPWDILGDLGRLIAEIGKTLPRYEYDSPSENVWIAKSATVAPSASIVGPTIICADAEIRQSAFIRGSAVIGCGAVIGNSCEVKNSVVFDKAQLPHFNYVGDSIIGYSAHFGAGVITSNVKGDKTNVTVHADGDIETGRHKLGAIVGDYAEIGCNTVLNPGTVIGCHARVYPLCSVRGTVKPYTLLKGDGTTVKVK